MNFDRIIGILGFLLTVIAVPLTYYFYRKGVRTKVLAYAYTKPVSLWLPFHDVPPDYHGEMEGSRVFMLLWNRGTAPIERSDFVHPIKILPTNQVLRILAHEGDAAAAATVDEAEQTISIDLLRPGEAMIFLIDSVNADYRPEISVMMKSAEMSVFLRSAPLEVRNIIAIVASIATFVLLTGTMMWSAVVFELLLPEAPKPVPASILLALVISAFVVIGLTYWVHKLARQSLWWLTPVFPYKFFSMQETCAEMNRSWRWLRQQSEWLMAMG